MRRAGALLSAALLATPSPAAEASSAARDLHQVYALAAASDPKFRAAEAGYLAVRERLPQARAALLPTLRAQGERLRNDIEQETTGTVVGYPPGEARYSSVRYALNLSQPIYNHAAFAGLDQAAAEVRAAEAEYAAARQDLMVRVAEAYLGVLLAEHNLRLAQAERSTIARQLETAEARLRAGLATVTDVHDARARHESAAAQEIDAANRVADAREALRELTGAVSGALKGVNAALPLLTPEPPDLEQWVRAALERNFQVVARRAAAEQARAEVSRQRGGHFPTLDLVGSRNRSDADGSIPGPGIRTDTTTLGLQLNVPIFQGGAVTARTAEAAHRLTAAEQELEAAQRSTERAARAGYLGVTGGAARVRALRQAVDAASAALEAKTEGYRAGIHTSLQVLDATRDLYRARRDLSEAVHAYLLSLLRLKQAAGTLSENDLLEVNSWLAPAPPGDIP